jgi:hypothetical protein
LVISTIVDADTDTQPRTGDFAIAFVSRSAAKPAPKANRITGPKLFAAATPAK